MTLVIHVDRQRLDRRSAFFGHRFAGRSEIAEPRPGIGAVDATVDLIGGERA